ncbi:CKLF6 protein, partial [Heliornis fulica]|nr:CKLF6 protein [Heliornis fulica]
MENSTVYNETTEPQAKPPRRLFSCTLQHLRGWRLPTKVLQAILSLLAVICEEMVENCTKCSGLYFFEFISCSAFLLSILILFMYCTEVYEKFGEDKVQRM